MKEVYEYTIQQRNLAYMHILSAQEKRKLRNQSKTFSQQEISISDLAIIPKGYESIAYFLYALLLPYFTGYIFLYLLLPRMSFSHNPFNNVDNFFIVWIIGYEIISIILLLWIFKLFFTFDEKDN